MAETNKNTFIHKLNRPYYLETVIGKRLFSALKFGVFVFLFLIIFRPFGLSELPEGILKIALGYGLTTFLVMALLSSLLMPLLPSYFSESKWNVRRELYWNMLNVLLIGLANALYSVYIGIVPANFSTCILISLYTVTTAIFPIAITVLLKEAQLKNNFEKKSQQINESIEEHITERSTEDTNPLILILSENEKDRLEISLNDLIYIQSSENYVEVYYRDKKKLLRTTLKAVAFELEKHKVLFRCHKSYVVNMNKVNHVSGNAQGYKLHLLGTDNLIPVSRQNNEEVKKRLSA